MFELLLNWYDQEQALAHTLAHTLVHNLLSTCTLSRPGASPGAHPGAHLGTPRHDQVKAPVHTLAHTLVHDLLSMLTLGRPGTSLGAYLNSASRKPWRIPRCRIGRTLTFEVPEVRGGFWRIPSGAYPPKTVLFFTWPHSVPKALDWFFR